MGKKKRKRDSRRQKQTRKVRIKGEKGKAIPVTGREDPSGCETSRLLHCR
jgi:hypothetical protein